MSWRQTVWVIRRQTDSCTSESLAERRPPTARLELGIRREQVSSTDHTGVCSQLLVVQVFTCERPRNHTHAVTWHVSTICLHFFNSSIVINEPLLGMYKTTDQGTAWQEHDIILFQLLRRGITGAVICILCVINSVNKVTNLQAL